METLTNLSLGEALPSTLTNVVGVAFETTDGRIALVSLEEARLLRPELFGALPQTTNAVADPPADMKPARKSRAGYRRKTGAEKPKVQTLEALQKTNETVVKLADCLGACYYMSKANVPFMAAIVETHMKGDVRQYKLLFITDDQELAYHARTGFWGNSEKVVPESVIWFGSTHETA